MLRPNFQVIDELPEKNYLKYISLYRMDDMVCVLLLEKEAKKLEYI